MGCLCSKESRSYDYDAESHKVKQIEPVKSPVPVIAPFKKDEVIVGVSQQEPLRSRSNRKLESSLSSVRPLHIEDNSKTRIIERPKNGHRRHSTLELGGVNGKMSRLVSIPHPAKGEQVAAGWPPWLASVAGEAIKGWVPRGSDSYEKLGKIGQGTYSSVYMARDLKTEKIVAMKKVRFVNMDPESVRFMAREICILRRLDHPNVMKLEALVTSRVSGSLYLVFEYMEHDLAGLLISPKVKFTKPQIKCYMQQMLRGLEHCHGRGVLHRDIKGSNLLVDNNGVLKIGDFGLATAFEPGRKQPLTSRVVTLWYRAPELLLGARDYGPAIDLWSAGCILAELFAEKPIMPGRTEVEQMHKILKLCGSPTADYWKKRKLPHASSFKSQPVYKRRVADTFNHFPSSALALIEVLLSIDPEERGSATSALNSQFFTSDPLPCDPSSIPRYPPSKELDARIRAEAKRKKAESLKGCGAENDLRKDKAIKEGEVHSNTSKSDKYNPGEETGTGFRIGPPRGRNMNKTVYSQPNTVFHQKAVGYKWNQSIKEDPGRSVPPLKRQASELPRPIDDSSDYHLKTVGRAPNNDSEGYLPKKNRMLFSGPLLPPGGNMEDMLKEHERQIQEAVRKARTDRGRA